MLIARGGTDRGLPMDYDELPALDQGWLRAWYEIRYKGER